MKRNKPATKIDMVARTADVQRSPDSFLHELAARFGAGATGIRHALKRLKVIHPGRISQSMTFYQKDQG